MSQQLQCHRLFLHSGISSPLLCPDLLCKIIGDKCYYDTCQLIFTIFHPKTTEGGENSSPAGSLARHLASISMVGCFFFRINRMFDNASLSVLTESLVRNVNIGPRGRSCNAKKQTVQMSPKIGRLPTQGLENLHVTRLIVVTRS